MTRLWDFQIGHYSTCPGWYNSVPDELCSCHRNGMKSFILIKNDPNDPIKRTIKAHEISDGYHTFTELYNHRYALYIALVKIYDNYITPLQTRIKCWKSKFHSDGSSFEGWFILGMTITEFTGPEKQISYHLPISYWDKVNVIDLDRAPQWDGHTSRAVIERLLGL